MQLNHVDFILRNTPRKSSFSDSLEREDENVYPVKAIREGLVNAFVHRDYSNYSGSLSVSIYPNRIEIWNIGTFPEGINPEELGISQVSILRNPDIAHIMYLRRFMEKLGRGGALIKNQCEESNLPAPKWETDGSGVTLTIFAPVVNPEDTPVVDPEDTPVVTPEVQVVINVLEGEMSKKEIQNEVGLKDEEHFRKAYINAAIDLGVIERTIPDKPTSSKQKYRLTLLGKIFKK